MVLLPAPGWSGDLPVVGISEIEGRAAPILLGRPNATLRVYAFRQDGLATIPFQVDERDRRDHWADDEGIDPIRDDHPGVFDLNDVVAIMNRDLGARGDPKRLPPGASAWVEVRIGSADAPLGYAYVGTFPAPEPSPGGSTAQAPPFPGYAHYDPHRDQVSTDRYTVRFDGPLPSCLALDGDGDVDTPPGDDVLNAVHAFGAVRILGGIFHFERSDRDLRYTVQGYREGPVRVIRSAKYWIPLPLGFKARGRVELLFYGNFVEGRARVNVKISPRLIPADGEVTAYFDFRDFAGAHVLGPEGELAQPIDGRMTELKRSFTRVPVRWSALLLPNGRAFLLAVRLEDSLARLDQRLYLDDSPLPGRGMPAFGFRLSGVNRLETGEQELSVNAMILDTTSPQDVAHAARLLLDPPEVTITPLGGPAARRPLPRPSARRR